MNKIILKTYSLLEDMIYSLSEQQFAEFVHSIRNDKQLTTTVFTIRQRRVGRPPKDRATNNS